MVFITVSLGTLGAGNHYAEIQVVDEIYNTYAAKKMGVDHLGQVSMCFIKGATSLNFGSFIGRPKISLEKKTLKY